VSISNSQIAVDYALTAPDAHVIASAWVRQVAGLKGNAPAAADLAEMITGVGSDFTMQGAPQLQIDVLDQNWTLLDSGFFDPSDGGTLDRVDVNYPDGSRYWWVLFQYSPKADYSVQTYWIPRVVYDLMHQHGPFQVNRASRTRARFLKMCTEKVPYANFYCKQIDVKQPIAPLVLTPSVATAATTSGPKSVGLSAKASKGLTIGGTQMSSSQRTILHTALRVADQLGAGDVATTAMVYAAMGETGVAVKAGGGVWQDTSSPNPSNVADEAKAFLTGLYGFAKGGAIGLAATSNDPVYVANATELNAAFLKSGRSPTNYADSYGPHLGGTASALKEARAIVAAGGGATGLGGVQSSAIESVQQYNFSIGTTQDPREDYWTGMNRLAQEVNWELVVDGDDIYYDSDVTLCRAAIEAVVDRLDEAVADWSYDWDLHHIATNMRLVLECGPFDFRAADVFQLKRFGPASAGSSIGLPGRWLVGEIQRNPGDVVSTFTLVQPTRPLKEPAPQVVSSTSSGAGGAAAVGTYAPATVLSAVQAAQRLSNMGVSYVYGGSHGPGMIATTKAATLRSQGLDCSSSTCWVLHQAGMFPSDSAITSGALESWGQPGPGKEMTVWCNADHVFIEFHVPNIGHMQMNTDVPGQNGPRFVPWGPNGSSCAASGAYTPRHYPGT
jgi:hypothetical protein